jgi:hypothetical protein
LRPVADAPQDGEASSHRGATIGSGSATQQATRDAQQQGCEARAASA